MSTLDVILAAVALVAVTWLFAKRQTAAILPPGHLPIPYKGEPLAGLTPGPVALPVAPAMIHPVRSDVHHAACGKTTTIGVPDSEWIARGWQPATIQCAGCGLHVAPSALSFADGSGLVSAAISATPPLRING